MYSSGPLIYHSIRCIQAANDIDGWTESLYSPVKMHYHPHRSCCMRRIDIRCKRPWGYCPKESPYWFDHTWCQSTLVNDAPNLAFNFMSWWCHQMETRSALLAICAGNSPVPGEFPAQRPVTRSFDVFFVLRPNKRLSKQWWGWWFETPSRPLWRFCNMLGRSDSTTIALGCCSMQSPVYVIMMFACVRAPSMHQAISTPPYWLLLQECHMNCVA